MNKYLSLIFLYNRAGGRKLLLTAAIIPIGFILIFLIRVGNPYEAGSYMLMERAFGGIWAVLPMIAACLLGLMAVADSLSGKKALKASCATTGYTIRRLCISPVKSYLTIFVYYLVILIIFWAIAIASLLVIGRLALSMAGAESADAALALGLLRTEIGHALIPVSHPIVIIFDITAVLALAGQCAKSCYLSWHNGTPSAGVALVIIPMLIVWAFTPESSYILVAILVVALYSLLTLGDVIFRERRPKGDPFKVNKHDGIVDLDSSEYDDNVFVEVNSASGMYASGEEEGSALEKYGRVEGEGERKSIRRYSIGRLRRRFLPIGINMEKANFLFGACIMIGIAEHFVFYGKYMTQLNQLRGAIKGVTIEAGMQMPYFWELQQHTYYGYIAAILAAFFLQAFWNYEYYNKKTKSVYVMKRLPDRKEYPRTIWVTPALQAAVIVVIMAAQTVFDACLYMLATPDIALKADYLTRMLPF